MVVTGPAPVNPPVGGRPRRSRRDALVRLGRWWQRSAGPAELRARRLHLGRVQGVDRGLVIAALGASAVAVISLIAAQYTAVRPSYLQITSRWPWFVTGGLVVGLITMQALMLRCTTVATKSWARLLFRAAYVFAALGPLASIAQWLRRGTLVYPESGASTTFWTSGSFVALGLSAVAVAAALFPPGRRAGIRIVAAAVPALALTVEWTGVHLGQVTGSAVALAGNTDSRFPPTSDLGVFLDFGLISLALIVAGTAMAATLWGVAEGARASVDGSKAGRALFRRLLRRPATAPSRPDATRAWWVLVAVLAVKCAWAVLGIAGLLPPALGGTMAVWDDIRSDGRLSWALAALVGAGCAVWLLIGAPRPRDGRGVTAALAALVGVLVLPEIAFQLLASSNVLGQLDWALTAALRVEAYQPWAPVVACVVGIAAGGYLIARRTHGGAAVLLVAFGVWSLLRCAALAVDLARYPWFPWGIAPVSEDYYGQRPGWLDIASVELAVTVALLVVGLIAVLTSHRPAMAPLLLLLVVLPLVVYLTPVIDQAVEAPFGSIAAFVAPFAYLFLFDAEDLNTRIDRGRTLIYPMALTVLSLIVGLVRGTATGTPTAGQDTDLGSTLLVLPVIATMVVLSSRPRRHRPNTTPPA